MHRPPILLVLASALLIAVAARESGLNDIVLADKEQHPPKRRYFTREDPVGLWIPRLGLKTRLNFAPLVDGAFDGAALKRFPAWIDPRAGPGLGNIGQPGTGLILGHRQWGLRPLVFARLDKLQHGDQVIVFGHDLELAFTVCGKVEIAPADLWTVIDRAGLAALQAGRPSVILVTCAPYGHNRRRLLIFAGQ